DKRANPKATPPVWQSPGGKGSGRHLYNACRGDDVSGRNPINFTPFCLLEEAAHGQLPSMYNRPKPQLVQASSEALRSAGRKSRCLLIFSEAIFTVGHE